MNHHNEDLNRLTDRQVVDLYREWSEEFWCAGFMDPTPNHVEEFIGWLLDEAKQKPFEDYELELIARFRHQIVDA